MAGQGFFGSKAGLVGIGLLAFGVIAIASLSIMTSGGRHPLALERDVDLCGLMGELTWAQLQYPASDAVARVPENAMQDTATCALELDPVAPEDRWGRVARGEDANEVRRIATVMLTTTAMMRSQSPDARTDAYARTFGDELVTSGWQGREINGPWTTGTLYRLGETEVSALIEDEGVMLWITASEVTSENLAAFARTTAEMIRQEP